jgi:hypothetical protein
MDNLFHVHLTLAYDVDRTPRGWKKTEIVLIGGKPQTDSMITRHYSFSESVLRPLEVILFDCEQMMLLQDVVRIKVEKDNNFEPITHDKYLECHLKVKGLCNLGPNWIRSKNPKHVDEDGQEVYFWNRRIREEMPWAKAEEIILFEIAASGLEYFIECKIEQNVYDSLVERDLWWENNEH